MGKAEREARRAKLVQQQQQQRAQFNWTRTTLLYIPLQCAAAWWLELGIPFFMLTCLWLIYMHTGSSGDAGGSEEGKQRTSAYSVFNPGVQRMDGALTADAFERELRVPTSL
jgi:hypothetical protein